MAARSLTAKKRSVSTSIVSTPDADTDNKTSEPMLEVTIADTGAGIAAEHLGRLFEPFYSTKPQGTGLGLAITRRIILEHHGKIGVESEVQKGSTFLITLPLWKPQPWDSGTS